MAIGKCHEENDIRPGKDVMIVSSDCSGSLEAVENGETFGTGFVTQIEARFGWMPCAAVSI